MRNNDVNFDENIEEGEEFQILSIYIYCSTLRSFMVLQGRCVCCTLDK
jgi:hypothetical protein